MFCWHLRFAISTRFNNGPIVPKAKRNETKRTVLLMANGQVVKLNRVRVPANSSSSSTLARSESRALAWLGLPWPGATENFVFASLFNVHVIEMHLQLNYK